jgi:hypothetical protein
MSKDYEKMLVTTRAIALLAYDLLAHGYNEDALETLRAISEMHRGGVISNDRYKVIVAETEESE